MARTLQRNKEEKTDFLSSSHGRRQVEQSRNTAVRVLPTLEPLAPSSSSTDTLAPIFGDTQKPLFQTGRSPVSSSRSTVP